MPHGGKPDKAKLSLARYYTPDSFNNTLVMAGAGERPATASFWSDNLNLSLLSALIPRLASEGPMNLQVQASGSVRRPLWPGPCAMVPGHDDTAVRGASIH